MSDIIDVEYREVTTLSEMSTEELANSANLYWSQMELLGRMGLELAAKAGDNLLEIKSRLKHGEWADWARDNLKFSLRKANYMMKLSTEMQENRGIFANSQTFANIEISKVWAPLGAPEEVRETIMKKPDVQEMTAREFKEEIKRLKEEAAGHKQKESEDAERIAELDAQLQATADVVVKLESQLKEASEKPGNEEELAKIKEKLQKAEEKLAKEKEARKKEKDKTEQIVEAAKAEAEEILRTKLEAETNNKMELLQMQYNAAMKEVDKLSKKLANNQQEDMVVFKVNASRLREDFNACMASIEKVAVDNPEQAEKMKAALGQFMSVLTGRV